MSWISAAFCYFTEQNFHLGFIGPGFNGELDLYGRVCRLLGGDRREGSLAGFFSLSTPRAFAAIPARLGPAYFRKQPPGTVGADDD